MLESRCHEFSSFPTLTYSEAFHPPGGSLVPQHTQAFLKRLRARLGPDRPIRYFLCGEYGERTWRPHYHIALFGVASIEGQVVADSWGMGMVKMGTLTLQSAQYISGYVTKKMTAKDDERLAGRHPEFARMSLRPGIGAPAMVDVANALNDSSGARFIAQSGDVPVVLSHGRRNLPLGRYLRRRLREEIGFDDPGAPPAVEAQRLAEMRALYEATDSRATYLALKPFVEWEKINQVEGRAKIWRKKGSI